MVNFIWWLDRHVSINKNTGPVIAPYFICLPAFWWELTHQLLLPVPFLNLFKWAQERRIHTSAQGEGPCSETLTASPGGWDSWTCPLLGLRGQIWILTGAKSRFHKSGMGPLPPQWYLRDSHSVDGEKGGCQALLKGYKIWIVKHSRSWTIQFAAGFKAWGWQLHLIDLVYFCLAVMNS